MTGVLHPPTDVRSVPRHEDHGLLTGSDPYAGDLRFADGAVLHVLRAEIAHGLITEIDVTDALALDGVVAVLTARDLVDDLGAVPTIHPRLGGDLEVARPYLQPILAHDRVRYVGEPVVMIVAESRAVAEDAAELVLVDVEPLDAVVDPVSASAGPALFAEGNEVSVVEGLLGDGDAAFATAPVVVEADLRVERHSAVPMECRAAAAEYHPETGRVSLWGVAKVPHWNRREICRQLVIDPADLRMRECAVGGSFGVRGELYPEDVLAVWCARRLRRTVTWTEDRWEHLVATNHGRGQVHRAAIAADRDGRVLALRTECWVDLGAYVRTNGLRVPELTVAMLPGPYAISHYSARAHCVVTSRTPLGTYRAPGRAESAFVRERLLDLLADELGLDPIELRRRNLLGPDDVPLDRSAVNAGPRVLLEDASFVELLDRVVATAPVADVVARRARGERVGIGVGLFLERSGIGPFEWAEVEILADGSVRVRSGATSVGQGVRTVLAQIAARVLDVPHDRVEVERLDTDVATQGIGTFGSRTTIMAGNAVARAASALVERITELAASHAGVEADTLVARDGGIETPDGAHRLAYGDAVQVVAAREPGTRLRADARFECSTTNSDFGAHLAVVRIEPDTGRPIVERLVLGFDVGPMVNPALVAGQMRGAAVQALGGALYERFAYDDNGTPLATTFMDYLLPTSAEVPPIDLVLDEEHPSPFNPLGLKGVGEGGMTGVMPAIANAVAAALGDQAVARSVPIEAGPVMTAIGLLPAASEPDEAVRP